MGKYVETVGIFLNSYAHNSDKLTIFKRHNLDVIIIRLDKSRYFLLELF